ncbi:MAG TPA: hypothetical protein VJ770_25495 [Stellaceae bacterium]|nr:hypothetical protein [Stellaceae bacterium]
MRKAALPASCQIVAINCYTAHISGRVDPDAPRRQHAYLRAIATLPEVTIHYVGSISLTIRAYFTG